MTDFKLEIQIDNAGLSALNSSQQHIAIVKQGSFEGQAVVWLALHPYHDEVLAWTSSYDVFGSSEPLKTGATLDTSNHRSAESGYVYPYADGQFQAGTPSLPTNQYGIKNVNSDHTAITAGLAQSAVLTEDDQSSDLYSAIVAVTLQYQFTGAFAIIDKIQVFPMAGVSSGQVISEISSNALTVDFTSVYTQVIHYDDASGRFVAGPLPS